MLLGSAATVAVAQSGAPQRCSPSTCAKPFFEGGKYGIRNAAGEITIPPRFDGARIATERYPGQPLDGLIIVELNGNIGFVNRHGIETLPPVYQRSHAGPQRGFLPIKRDGRACLVDANGQLAVACEYDSVFLTGNPNQFMVISEGKGRVITRSGEQVQFAQRSPQTPVPRAAPPPSAPPARAPSTPLPTFPSVARSYADSGAFADAVGAAMAGSAADKRYVLIALDRAGKAPASTSYSQSRYSAGINAVMRNPGIFAAAMQGASSGEASIINAMRYRLAGPLDIPDAPSGQPRGANPTPSPPVRTIERRRCYQVSRTRQVCYD